MTRECLEQGLHLSSAGRNFAAATGGAAIHGQVSESSPAAERRYEVSFESSLASRHNDLAHQIRSPPLSPACSRGLRLRGSRLTLAATYRLASSISASDRELVLTLTGLRGHEERRPPNGGGPDFELAATNCLAGLYVKLALARPAIVTSPPHGCPRQRTLRRSP